MRTSAVCLVVAAVQFLPISGNAQILRGTVTDHATGRPMEGVTIVLDDVSGRGPVETATNAAGGFSLRIPRDGSFVIRAGRLGYQTFQSDTVELNARDVVDIRLQLSVEPVDLQPIVVRVDSDSHLAEFERRRARSATGHFITRDEIERRPVSRPSELLIGIPAVTLDTQRDLQGIPQDRHIIRLRGATEPCQAHVFVDGLEVTQSGNSVVDDLLNAEWLGGVEVYSTGATAPAEYQRDGCGSVLFWTQARDGGGSWSWLKGVAAAGFVVLALILTR